MLISSLQNDQVKALVKLYQKSSYRRQTGLFVVEGEKEVRFAIEGAFECVALYLKEGHKLPNGWNSANYKVYYLSDKVYQKVAYRFKTESIIGVFKMNYLSLIDLVPEPGGIYVLLDRVDKPGNIGAILRSCDALGINGLICLEGDLYNPNTIRSSVGCLFHVPAYASNWHEVVLWTNKNHLNLYISHLEAELDFEECNYNYPALLVVGSESKGVRPEWEAQRHTKIKIPMKGKNDSLNVSVAAALLLHQIGKRQWE